MHSAADNRLVAIVVTPDRGNFFYHGQESPRFTPGCNRMLPHCLGLSSYHNTPYLLGFMDFTRRVRKCNWRRGSESNRRGRLCRPLRIYNIHTLTDLSTPITTPTRCSLHYLFVEIEHRYRFLYHFLMKTTLNLDDDLVAQAKAVATKERISLTKMIEEGLSRNTSQVTERADGFKRRLEWE